LVGIGPVGGRGHLVGHRWLCLSQRGTGLSVVARAWLLPTCGLSGSALTPWWLLPAVTLALLTLSLIRAARATR
jgi:hypothetical protein